MRIRPSGRAVRFGLKISYRRSMRSSTTSSRFVLLVVFALLASTCSSSASNDSDPAAPSIADQSESGAIELSNQSERGDGPAITVNGHSLSHSEAESYVGDRAAAGEDGSDPSLFARALSTFAINTLVADELSDRDIILDENDLRNAQVLLDRPGAPASKTAIADFAAQLRLAYALSDLEPLDEAAVRASYEAAPPVEVCSSHILLESDAEATEVLELLSDGADFAETAMEFSTGPSGPTGGDLGCTNPSSFVPEFAEAVTDADIGEVVGPVQTEFGFHVILVADRTQTDFAEAAPAIRAAALNETLPVVGPVFSEYVDAQTLDVEVDPFYGTWDSEQGIIAAP